MSKTQRISSALRGYARQEHDQIKKGVLVHAAEHIEKLERQRLREIARLSDTVCQWILDPEEGKRSEEVVAAASEIMKYVEAVRP